MLIVLCIIAIILGLTIAGESNKDKQFNETIAFIAVMFALIAVQTLNTM